MNNRGMTGKFHSEEAKQKMSNSHIKKYCKRNHLLDGNNLYLRPDGSRECRICNNLIHQRWIQNN